MARLRWSCCGLRAHAPTSGAGATGTSPMLLRWRWTVASNELNPDIALWPVVVAGGGLQSRIRHKIPLMLHIVNGQGTSYEASSIICQVRRHFFELSDPFCLLSYKTFPNLQP